MRNDRDGEIEATPVKRRRGGGAMTLLILVLGAIMVLLFYTGFWRADVTKTGALPSIEVSGGTLPEVDLSSKKVVVGSKQANVDLPTIETKNTSIEIPVVDVKEANEK